MILYKYVPFKSGIKIIESGKIGFSQPIYFNDPFDLPSYPKDKSLNILDSTFEEIRIWGKESIWAQSSGVLSMTRTPANKLMWAHYADMHKGMVIGIDVLKAGLTDEASNFIPAQFGDIKYVTVRPSGKFLTQAQEGMIVGSTHNFRSDHYEKTSRVFLHKSIEWSYEEEVRVVKCLKGIQNEDIETESGFFEVLQIDGRPLYLYTMGHKAIVEIYLGGRCLKNDQTAAFNLMKTHTPTTTMKRVQIDKEGFGLRFKQVKLLNS